MTKRKAAKAKRSTAPKVGAAISTPHSTAVAFKSEASAMAERDPRNTEGHATESDEVDTREVFSCVISLYPDDCRHHACANCGGANKRTMWTGTVTDSISESNEDAFQNVVFQCRDTPANRKSLLRDLQRRAQDAGFSHCEIRDYSHMVIGGYLPLYGGPIPAPNPAA